VFPSLDDTELIIPKPKAPKNLEREKIIKEIGRKRRKRKTSKIREKSIIPKPVTK